MSEYISDLVKRDGVYFKKFSEVPFTGNITGIEQGSFKNGKMEGVWVRYFDNGQLWDKGNWKNGKKEGACVAYYENGQLGIKGNLKNGKADGAWVCYNSDGTVDKYYTGTFKNNRKISD